MTDVTSKNIYKGPLHIFSHESPKTGYQRKGYCYSPDDDEGNHSVAGIVTEQFLDFTASQGNDLRKQVGIKPGDKWCLCANRWKQAFDARENDSDPKVPKVALHATHLKALNILEFKDLKKFAAEPESSNASDRAIVGGQHSESSMVRESNSIGGKEPKA